VRPGRSRAKGDDPRERETGMMGFGYIELLMILLLGVVFVLLVIGAIAAVVWLVRRGGAAGDGAGALRILRERYARGELSREEYERMRDDLRD
jgi:putative membrane protein